MFVLHDSGAYVNKRVKFAVGFLSIRMVRGMFRSTSRAFTSLRKPKCLGWKDGGGGATVFRLAGFKTTRTCAPRKPHLLFLRCSSKTKGEKEKKKGEKGGAFTLTPGADSIPSLHRRPALHAGEAQIRSRSIVSLRRALSKQNPDRFPFFNSQAVGSLSFPGQFFLF